ncbi:MAG: CRISPR-associated endonuclease Cas3'' [Desulfovibrio sp.]|jgi:CRISPR-associated endonuclease/helicase Cas3|nr:CRISPR-associated endonuclease Cas3'' [Desulfovibrio sp.]
MFSTNGKKTELLARPGQSLRDHLLAVGERTATFAGRFGAADWGRALGLLHDIGKAGEKFQRRVRGENLRVDHSTAGARQALSDTCRTAPNQRGVGKLIAYCLAGHHAGLPDGRSNEASSLRRRLDPAHRKIEDYSAWRDCLGADMSEYPDFTSCPFDTNRRFLGFRIAFFVRMLFSCLVDADRLDAEAAGTPRDRVRSARRTYPDIRDLRARLDIFLQKKSAAVQLGNVNRLRMEVLNYCRAAAKREPGLFSLTVPTGGGKTLSSLAFALAHAECRNLDRVVYVIPYTSIIEQNADVFREALNDGDRQFVIEHHSNLVLPKETDDDSPHPATENWDAPVIVTTAVQFFESLFSARTGRCRKLHNLAKSVIVLDEAQMLPLPFLRPCIEAIRELSASYGASIILCTATQPALNAPYDTSDSSGEGLVNGLTGVREIIPDPKALHASLKRVKIHHIGELSDVALVERLAAEPCVLCIVPTRRMARKIFDGLRDHTALSPNMPHDQDKLFHLSALMCPEHRTETLTGIHTALNAYKNGGSPCRVVSTTLVEAGVDLDFPVVYRAEAGIDSVAQAAGRCNREGRMKLGQVYVFRPESGLPAGLMRRSAQAARSVAERHQTDLLHPDAVRDYFLELYWQSGEDNLDAESIMKIIGETAQDADFPFREIEKKFHLIDAQTRGLIIPYDETAKELRNSLDSLTFGDNARNILRRLQRYSVSLYARDFAILERAGAVSPAGPGGHVAVLCNKSLYDTTFGLDLYKADPAVLAPEDLIW